MSNGEKFAQAVGTETASGCVVLVILVIVLVILSMIVEAVFGVLGAGVSLIVKLLFGIVYALGGSALILLAAYGTTLVIDLTYPIENALRHWYEIYRNAEACTHPALEDFQQGHSPDGFQDLFIIMLRDAYSHYFKRKADALSFQGNSAAFIQFRKKYLISFARSAAYRPVMDDAFARIYQLFADNRIDPRFNETANRYLPVFEKNRHRLAVTLVLARSMSFGRLEIPAKDELFQSLTLDELRGNQHLFYRFMHQFFFTLLDKCPGVLNARNYPMLKASVQAAKDTAQNRMKLLAPKLVEKEDAASAKAKASPNPREQTKAPGIDRDAVFSYLAKQEQTIAGFLGKDDPAAFLQQLLEQMAADRVRLNYSDYELDRAWYGCDAKIRIRLDQLERFDSLFDYYSIQQGKDFPKWFDDALPTGGKVSLGSSAESEDDISKSARKKEFKRRARVNCFKENKLV